MAWTSPRTWVVAETLTAALLNTHLRDQLNWLANDHPRCGAIRSTNQSITDSTLTAVSLTDADEFDTGPMHDPSGGTPSRVIVPSGGGGLYEVQGIAAWATGAVSSRRGLEFAKNGSGITGVGDYRAPDSTGNAVQSCSFFVTLAAADYIEMKVYQSTGGALNVTGRLQLRWVAF